MPTSATTGLVVSSFNAETFTRYIENSPDVPTLLIKQAPYGQVVSSLLQDEFYSPRPDFVFVWTEPQSVLPSFQRALEHETVSADAIRAEVDAFVGLLSSVRPRTGELFVPMWLSPEVRRDFAFFEWAPTGVSYLISHANILLADAAHQLGAHVLNAQAWVDAAGDGGANPQLRYMAKTPFSQRVFEEAALSVRAALKGLGGQGRKLVIVDLDDTIWGGVVGDIGWENLRLGGHDPVGEAFVDFQRCLKALTRRGILLGVASKNEESVAKEAIEKHPEMVLRIADLAGWEIGWSDKAKGIVALATRLNLGLDSVVFIDDNPAERSRVREALPGVLVPDWPSSPMRYRQALLSLRCFSSPGITREDRGRSESYVRQRASTSTAIGDLGEWLDSLGITVNVSPLRPESLSRASQLLNKTNQMNLATRRMAEADLRSWAGEPGHHVWTFSVSDRLGDSGLTGLVSLDVQGNETRVVDFILSCRVMGRRVEESLLYAAIQLASAAGSKRLVLDYERTERNRPCLLFLAASGLRGSVEDGFWWPLDEAYPAPRAVSLNGLETGATPSPAVPVA